jgi:hypothetical protein
VVVHTGPQAKCHLGYSLAVAPVLWDSLSPKEKENVENWLGNSINEKKCV